MTLTKNASNLQNPDTAHDETRDRPHTFNIKSQLDPRHHPDRQRLMALQYVSKQKGRHQTAKT
jgi:hypothetical protein